MFWCAQDLTSATVALTLCTRRLNHCHRRVWARSAKGLRCGCLKTTSARFWRAQDLTGVWYYDVHAAMQHVHALKIVWHYLDAVPGMKRPVAQCIGGLRGRVVCENRTPAEGIYCVACVKRLWIQ